MNKEMTVKRLHAALASGGGTTLYDSTDEETDERASCVKGWIIELLDMAVDLH